MKKTNSKWKNFINDPHIVFAFTIIGIAAILLMVIFISKHEAMRYNELHPPTDDQARVDDVKTPAPVVPVEDVIYEDECILAQKHFEGSYTNKVWTCEVGYGRSISIGVDDPNLTDAIYLNPVFNYEFAGNPNEKYGFLISSTYIPVEYSKVNEIVSGNEIADLAGTSFLITSRKPTTVVSATYKNADDFGVSWAKDTLSGGGDFCEEFLNIKVIRLSDNTILGAAIAHINYNNGHGEIDQFYNADLVSQGKLSDDGRDSLINTAINFICYDNDFYTISSANNSWQINPEVVIVELLRKPVSPQIIDIYGQNVKAGQFVNCDFYTLHIPYNGQGFYTFYFLPENQANGDRYNIDESTTGQELILVGFENPYIDFGLD